MSAAIVSGCTVINPPQSAASKADLTRFRTWAVAVYKAMYVDFRNMKIDLPEPLVPMLEHRSEDLLATAGATLSHEAEQELALVTLPGFSVKVLSADPRIVAVRLRGTPATELEDALRQRFLPVDFTAPSADPGASSVTGRPIDIFQLPSDGRLVAMMPEGDVLYVIVAGSDDVMTDGILELPAPDAAKPVPVVLAPPAAAPPSAAAP